MRAVVEEDSDTIKRLIARGVDVNEKDGSGAPAIIVASAKGSLPIVMLLAEAGADPNITAIVRAHPLPFGFLFTVL